jgi:spore coat protein A, manganese oxidase
MTGAQGVPLPGGTLDPLLIPKYVTPLVIPPVMKNTGTANDYDIAVRQFKQQILPGGIWNTLNGRTDAFPPTTVWSYGPDADPTPTVAPDPSSQFNYPAYTIENTSSMTTTVEWINQLVANPDACKVTTDFASDSACKFIPHLLPVDRSLHWANPEQLPCIEPGKTKDCAPDPAQLADPTILQQRYDGPVPMVVHVHGAHAGPESDGYAEAWWLPNANNIPAGYATKGTLVNQFGGIMTNVRPGVGTFTYPNTQPSSTVWYHDHSLGMTRNNVYAGPAGFWILRDPAATGGETGLASGTLPGPAPVAGDTVVELNAPALDPTGINKRKSIREIPIAIQDRSFNADGSLFYPTSRAFFEGLPPAQLQIPFVGDVVTNGESVTSLSDIAPIWNPEAFFNTMVVNGVTWPRMEVAPALYRVRLLNGCNSRFLNLSLKPVNPITGVPIGAIRTVWALQKNGKFKAKSETVKELPFYQIGAEQSLLPKVVRVATGAATPLPGNGTIPTPVNGAHPDRALLMGNAERADVILDFRGLPDGTVIQMFNTAPDAPFGGFPDIPSDPATTGQVMRFVVNSTLLGTSPTDEIRALDGTLTNPTTAATPPESLVLRPVEGVNTYPVGAINVNPTPRDQALLEEESLKICVTVAPTGAIAYDPAATPDPANPGTCLTTVTATLAASVPFAPKAAVLGVNGSSMAPKVTLWSDPIETNIDQGDTETWEFWNWTVDGHPIHVHEVKFKVLNREAFDPLTGALSGVVRPAEATEAGWKDTVIAYPGQVTRIAATFDLAGLYVWHCHIVEHEDNEMMVPYCIGDPQTAPGCRVVPNTVP